MCFNSARGVGQTWSGTGLPVLGLLDVRGLAGAALCPPAPGSEAREDLLGAFGLDNWKGRVGSERLEAFNNFLAKLSLLLYWTVSWTSSLGDMLKHWSNCYTIAKLIE